MSASSDRRMSCIPLTLDILSGTPGVQFSTEAIDIAVAAGETAAFEVTARFPDSYQTHAWTLTVDVTWDGVRHGQIAEAIAWW